MNDDWVAVLVERDKASVADQDAATGLENPEWQPGDCESAVARDQLAERISQHQRPARSRHGPAKSHEVLMRGRLVSEGLFEVDRRKAYGERDRDRRLAQFGEEFVDDVGLAERFVHHSVCSVRRRRGWRIDKPNPRANIDAIIALAMAVERAEQKPEPVALLGWL
ncbi:MAG: hypothetical protein H0U06_02230 [Solirubrobacterales bacterium]|nr:hypothetical protein [Solirubrobacterales bacterium]